MEVKAINSQTKIRQSLLYLYKKTMHVFKLFWLKKKQKNLLHS